MVAVSEDLTEEEKKRRLEKEKTRQEFRFALSRDGRWLHDVWCLSVVNLLSQTGFTATHQYVWCIYIYVRCGLVLTSSLPILPLLLQ